jgi:hypothetical protein
MRQTSMAIRAVANFLIWIAGVDRIVARGINRGLTTRYGGNRRHRGFQR